MAQLLALPLPLRQGLIRYAEKHPYFHLPGYMERYWIIPKKPYLPFAARLHHILRSDNDRDLHDHPWDYASYILDGGYWEILPKSQKQPFADDRDENNVTKTWWGPGSFRTASATTRHRLIVPAGKTAWTLFIHRPKSRDWGFGTPNGWVHNEQYFQEFGEKIVG